MSRTKRPQGTSAINPVQLAVLRGRLEQIADEMDATLFRSAFNPIIAEAHDASHGLYDAETGETLVQGKEGLPVFVGVMAFAVRHVIELTRDNPPVDGDVYIFNDPYEGGTHLSDFKLVRPVFRNGKIFCYLASVGHWHDVGGTFTDLFFLDRSTGTVTTGKVPSTVADQSIGLVDGISRELTLSLIHI